MFCAFRKADIQIQGIHHMLISPAFAQAGGAGGGGLLGGLLPIVLIVFIFYFLMIRPQMKRQKQHGAMVAALKRGDRVVTNGGITGVVVKAVEGSETVEVEIARDVKVDVVRTMIADSRSKDAPVSSTPSTASDKKSKKR